MGKEDIKRVFLGHENGELEEKPVEEKPVDEKKDASGRRIFYGDKDGNLRMETPGDKRPAIAKDFVNQVNERIEEARTKLKGKL